MLIFLFHIKLGFTVDDFSLASGCFSTIYQHSPLSFTYICMRVTFFPVRILEQCSVLKSPVTSGRSFVLLPKVSALFCLIVLSLKVCKVPHQLFDTVQTSVFIVESRTLTTSYTRTSTSTVR